MIGSYVLVANQIETLLLLLGGYTHGEGRTSMA